MAVYKVPQDVEAEDKLVGFLSLKQFIFAIIAVVAGYLCFLMFRTNILLGFIPLPVALFFAILAFWQRKDQPIETYLSALVRFFLKPHSRVWDQDGVDEIVEITVPKKIEKQYTDNLSSDQVKSRLDNLGKVMDSRGWVTRGQQYSRAPQVSQLQNEERLVSVQNVPGTKLEQVPGAVLENDDVYNPANPAAAEIDQRMQSQQEQHNLRTQQIIEEARYQHTSQDKLPKITTLHENDPPQKQPIKALSVAEPKPKTKHTKIPPTDAIITKVEAKKTPKTKSKAKHTLDEGQETIVDLR